MDSAHGVYHPRSQFLGTYTERMERYFEEDSDYYSVRYPHHYFLGTHRGVWKLPERIVRQTISNDLNGYLFQVAIFSFQQYTNI